MILVRYIEVGDDKIDGLLKRAARYLILSQVRPQFKGCVDERHPAVELHEIVIEEGPQEVGLSQEYLSLGGGHRVIAFEELFRGTIDGTSVYPREVVKEALSANAAAVILAHNHPSGVAEPSQADERITRRLKAALELVDIRLLDHLVIGDGEAVSLASRGLC